MIPWIANRGNSFKGAAMYYLHDKKAQTNERVAWTLTHNLPTDDPHKAMKWMAATAIQAEALKKEAGVKLTGRKSTKGVVYAYALAWHPDEKPQQEHMQAKAMETLDLLGLSDHQVVMVAHQETDHDHVHCIVNLVHPETGKTAVIYKDQLKLSQWALDYEKQNGQVYCTEREKNNELRQQKANQNQIIKHKEEKLERANLINSLYTHTDSGKAFSAALEEQGYTIAKGDKRGFVLVNHNGEIFSLSRQLEGQRAADIKARLSDLDQNTLPEARTVSESRLHFYRDDYEAQWQQNLIEEANAQQMNQPTDTGKNDSSKSPRETTNIPDKSKELTFSQILERNRMDNLNADKKIEFGRKLNSEFNNKKKELDEFYNLQQDRDRIQELETKLKSAKGIFNSFKRKELEQELNELKLNYNQAEGTYQNEVSKLSQDQEERKRNFEQSLSNPAMDTNPKPSNDDLRQYVSQRLENRNLNRGYKR